MVYAMVSPTLLCVFGATTVLSTTPLFAEVIAGAKIATGTLSVHRAAAGQVLSPPPLTVAVLSPEVALALTATFKVTLVVAPTAKVPLKSQLMLVVPLHAQLVPLKPVNVIPVGKVSLTVRLPLVAAEPMFSTVMV